MIVPIRPNEINSGKETIKIPDGIISAINNIITSQGGHKILVKEKDIKRKAYSIDCFIEDSSLTEDVWMEVVNLYMSYGWYVERNILPDTEPYNEDIVFYIFRKIV